jgi:hypothetical protein
MCSYMYYCSNFGYSICRKWTGDPPSPLRVQSQIGSPSPHGGPPLPPEGRKPHPRVRSHTTSRRTLPMQRAPNCKATMVTAASCPGASNCVHEGDILIGCKFSNINKICYSEIPTRFQSDSFSENKWRQAAC